MKRSPWGSPQHVPSPCSLSAVMDEELAKTMQEEEERQLKYVYSMCIFISVYVVARQAISCRRLPWAR